MITATPVLPTQTIRLGETWQRPAPHWLAKARSNATADVHVLWQALEEVEDPEYPISVVDMGLIYSIRLENNIAYVDLTFTSMGCPCMEYILDDIRVRLLKEPIVREVALKIVWEPAWTRKMLTDSAVEKLKSWGVSV